MSQNSARIFLHVRIIEQRRFGEMATLNECPYSLRETTEPKAGLLSEEDDYPSSWYRTILRPFLQ